MSQELSFKIDPIQNPKTVDLHWLEDNKKITWKGIYALKDDEVRVALSVKTGDKSWERGNERPNSFDTSRPPKDSWVLVLVLKRAKAPQPAARQDEKVHPPLSVAFNGFGAVALSPDGKWLAASGAPGTTVRLWETATGKEIAVLQGHDSEVYIVVFSGDGKRLFTATTTEVRTWELPRGKPLRRIADHFAQHSKRLTLSGDDKWLLSDPDMEGKMTADGKFVRAAIRLWELETGKEVRTFEIVRTTAQLLGQYADYFARGKGSDAILGTAFSNDGKWVVAGTERGEVHLWDTAAGKKVRTFGRSNDAWAIPVGFSKDGKWLASSVSTPLPDRRKTNPPATVLLWDTVTGMPKHAIQHQSMHKIQGNLYVSAFNPILNDDGKWLLTSCQDNAVRIWNVETGKEVCAFSGHKTPVTACFVSSDKKLVTTYDYSGTVRQWDVGTGKELRAIEVLTGLDTGWKHPDCKVRVSRDAKVLVSWTPCRLTLWDLEQGKAIRSMKRKVDE